MKNVVKLKNKRLNKLSHQICLKINNELRIDFKGDAGEYVFDTLSVIAIVLAVEIDMLSKIIDSSIDFKSLFDERFIEAISVINKLKHN